MKRWWELENVGFFAWGIVLLYPSQCWELTDYINSLLFFFLSTLTKLCFTQASSFMLLPNYIFNEYSHVCQEIKDMCRSLGTF